MTNMEIAETILIQLGGKRFIAFTGAKNFTAIKNGLQFNLPKNACKVNCVQITLNTVATSMTCVSSMFSFLALTTERSRFPNTKKPLSRNSMMSISILCKSCSPILLSFIHIFNAYIFNAYISNAHISNAHISKCNTFMTHISKMFPVIYIHWIFLLLSNINYAIIK